LTAGAPRATDADLLFQIEADTSVYPDLLAAAAISSGEFITDYDLDSPTTTPMSSYQDGDSTLKQLAEAMLLAGGPNGRRLLASVDINRKVRIYEEPAATATYLMDKTGKLMTGTGGAVIPYMPPVGVYVRILDMLPASADLGLFSDPTLQFIEGAEWSAGGGLKVEFRGERLIDELTHVNVDAPRASTGFRPVIVRPTNPRIDGLQ